VVREHWRGGGDIVALAESAATVAPLLIPRRISRVLISKVKPTAEGTGILVNASKFEPLWLRFRRDSRFRSLTVREGAVEKPSKQRDSKSA